MNRRVLVHSTGQDIENIRIQDEQAKEVPIFEVSQSHPQILEVETAEDLIVHKNYTLYIEFSGRIDNPRMSGIFSTPYIHENEKRWKTSTHLQTQEARSLFPCIDTPEAKAYFETNITHPSGTQALFNTIETSVDDNGDVIDCSKYLLYSEWTTTSFERTSVMSTYLFALAVSSMPYKETHTRNGVRVRPNTIREYSSAQRRDHVGTATLYGW
uniref:Peptidase_M1_N domain-containing protein n=1 Tax=Heterorhabditis bacteriophora TaxID=37862 RepID=A0A1I7XM39_HETBA